MSTEPRLAWKSFLVDDEAFEWTASDGPGTELVQRTKPLAKQLCVLIRCAGAPPPTFGIEWTEASPPVEADAVKLVRRFPHKFVHDPATKAARRDASVVLSRWPDLSPTERSKLSRLWVERWEKRIGRPPPIDDPTDLFNLSARALLGARKLGDDVREEERAAQERDVKEALERSTDS